MSDLNFDPQEDLEQRLHELQQYAPEATDELWKGIEARLPKRRRRALFLWWLAGSSALATLTMLTNQFPGKRHVSAYLQPAIVLPKENLNIECKIGFAEMLPSENLFPFKKYNPAYKKGETLPLDANPIQNPIVGAVILPIAKISDFGIAANVLSIPIITQLPVRPISAMVIESSTLPTFRFPTKTNRKSRFQFGINAAPVWIWQTSTTPDPGHTGQLMFAEHHNGPATGWQKGISIGYQLAPNWHALTGLSQRKTSLVSSHIATLRIMDGICLNPYDNGPKEYEFQYGLHSGVDRSNVTVRIAQVDSMSTMPANEPFALDMHTTRHMTEWVLPLSLQRDFGRGRWHGFLQAGGQLTIPGKTDLVVEHYTEACIDLCFANGKLPKLSVSERGKANISGLFAAGMTYKITPRWSASFAPTLFARKGQTGLSINTGIHFNL